MNDKLFEGITQIGSHIDTFDVPAGSMPEAINKAHDRTKELYALTYPTYVSPKPALPWGGTVPHSFLVDALEFTKAYYQEGYPYGDALYLQREMLLRYPPILMEWLFETVGWFGDYPFLGGDEDDQ